jgi:hypothetical protein
MGKFILIYQVVSLPGKRYVIIIIIIGKVKISLTGHGSP